jgi:hypothetical protein
MAHPTTSGVHASAAVQAAQADYNNYYNGYLASGYTNTPFEDFTRRETRFRPGPRSGR